jgi:hypothetical protein
LADRLLQVTNDFEKRSSPEESRVEEGEDSSTEESSGEERDDMPLEDMLNLDVGFYNHFLEDSKSSSSAFGTASTLTDIDKLYQQWQSKLTSY